MRSFFYFFTLSLNISLGTFLVGYFLTVYNPLQTQLSYIYGWNNDSLENFYEEAITSLVPLGAIIANFFSPKLLAKFGRRKSCFILDFFCIIGTLFTLFANIPCLIIGRFLSGLIVGFNSLLVGIYLKEINPLEHVHFFSSMGGLMLNFGMFVSFLLGINIISETQIQNGENDNWWRVMFGFPIFISLLRSTNILLFFNHESPIYLIMENKHEDALKTISNLYGIDDTQTIYGELKNEVLTQKESEKNIKYSQFFSKKYFLRSLICVILIFGNQYSGVNAISFYSTKLFKNLTGSESFANYLNGGLGTVNLISGLLIALPLKHLGVRKTYLISSFGSGLSLCLIAVFVFCDLKFISTIFVFGYYFFFSLGVGPIIFMLIPQFLPDKFVSVCFILMWILAFIIGITCLQMMDSGMGVGGTFLFFSCCCFFTFVFNYFVLPDTTGKTSEEIEEIFEGKEKDNRFLKMNEDNELEKNNRDFFQSGSTT